MLNKELEVILNKIEELESLEIELKVDDPEIEFISIHLFSKNEFEEGQLGYSVDNQGNSLVGNSEGDWDPEVMFSSLNEFLECIS
ncbi:hypothetical protein HPK19_09790 [Arthrobacter citreus]|nr:hypothetical protein HPK19_09790 [Arthrobacter citreus]